MTRSLTKEDLRTHRQEFDRRVQAAIETEFPGRAERFRDLGGPALELVGFAAAMMPPDFTATELAFVLGLCSNMNRAALEAVGDEDPRSAEAAKGFVLADRVSAIKTQVETELAIELRSRDV